MANKYSLVRQEDPDDDKLETVAEVDTAGEMSDIIARMDPADLFMYTVFKHYTGPDGEPPLHEDHWDLDGICPAQEWEGEC